MQEKHIQLSLAPLTACIRQMYEKHKHSQAKTDQYTLPGSCMSEPERHSQQCFIPKSKN